MRRFTILSLLLISSGLFTACGKNMAVRGPRAGSGGGAQKTPEVAGLVDVAKVGSVPATVTLTDNGYTTFGTLQPQSIEDRKDLAKLGLPVDSATVSNLGQGPRTTKLGLRKFIDNGTYIFRGIFQYPPKELSPKVKTMKLVLRGVRRYVPKDTNYQGLEKQILCSISAKLCSGEMPESVKAVPMFKDAKLASGFEKNKLPVNYNNFKNGGKLIGLDQPAAGSALSLTAPDGTLEIDLLALFPAYKEYDYLVSDVASAPYATPNYRKILFALADQTYFDSGDLIVEFDVADAKNKVKKSDINVPIASFQNDDDARMNEKDSILPKDGGEETCSDSAGPNANGNGNGNGNPIPEPVTGPMPVAKPVLELLITDAAGKQKVLIDPNDPTACAVVNAERVAKGLTPLDCEKDHDAVAVPPTSKDLTGDPYYVILKDKTKGIDLVNLPLDYDKLCEALASKGVNIKCRKAVPAPGITKDALLVTDVNGVVEVALDPQGNNVCDELKKLGINCSGPDAKKASIVGTPRDKGGNTLKSRVILTGPDGVIVYDSKRTQDGICKELLQNGVNIACDSAPPSPVVFNILVEQKNKIIENSDFHFSLPNNSLKFATGKSTIPTEGKTRLQNLVSEIRKIETDYPGVIAQMAFVGSADMTGFSKCKKNEKCNIEENFKLSDQRANAVLDVIKAGNLTKAVTFESRGMGSPINYDGVTKTPLCKQDGKSLDCDIFRVVEFNLDLKDDIANQNVNGKAITKKKDIQDRLNKVMKANFGPKSTSEEGNTSIIAGGRYYLNLDDALTKRGLR